MLLSDWELGRREETAHRSCMLPERYAQTPVQLCDTQPFLPNDTLTLLAKQLKSCSPSPVPHSNMFLFEWSAHTIRGRHSRLSTTPSCMEPAPNQPIIRKDAKMHRADLHIPSTTAEQVDNPHKPLKWLPSCKTGPGRVAASTRPSSHVAKIQRSTFASGL